MRHNLFHRPPSHVLATDLRHDESLELQLRRAAVAVSLVGIASMAAVTLYQTGVLRHLPDPPLDGFDADHVNHPGAAAWGAPDGFAHLRSHAVNMALAAAGTRDRTAKRPWLPMLAAGYAAAQAITTIQDLSRMPRDHKAWCGYRIVDALANLVTFALTVPEAWRAASATIRRYRTG